MTVTDLNVNLPDGYPATANQVVVQIDGQPVRVVRYEQFDEPIYFVHASLPASAECTFDASIKRYYTSWALHPRRLGIEVERAGRKRLRFRTGGGRNLVLECDGLGYLCFVLDPLQEAPSGRGVVDAGEFGLRPDPSELQTAGLQRAIDTVSRRTGISGSRRGPKRPAEPHRAGHARPFGYCAKCDSPRNAFAGFEGRETFRSEEHDWRLYSLK